MSATPKHAKNTSGKNIKQSKEEKKQNGKKEISENLAGTSEVPDKGEGTSVIVEKSVESHEDNKDLTLKQAPKTPKTMRSISAAKSKLINMTALKKPHSFSKTASLAKLKTYVKLSKFPATPTMKEQEEDVAAEENSVNENKEKSNEEYSLHNQLVPVMKDVSRQKLRSFRMAIRKIYASSEEGSVTINDAKSIISDLKIPIHSRLLNFLITECETMDEKVDHEKMITYFQKAHSMSGRDSVEAIDAEEIDSGLMVQTEITDAELYQRAEIQLMNSKEAFNLEKFRNSLKDLDKSRSGILPKRTIEKEAVNQNCFVYGSLLNSLLRRSDQSKNDQIRWPEFVNFVEKLYKDVLEKNPDFEKRFVNKQVIKPILSRDALRNKFKSLAARTISMERAQKESQDQSKQKNKTSKVSNGDKKSTTETKSKMKTTINKKVVKISALGSKKKTVEKSAESKEIEKEKDIPDKSLPDHKDVLEFQDESLKGLCPSDDALLKNLEASAEDLPTDKIKIEWVYGFRGQDILCNLNILSSGELVYFTGEVVILFDFIHHVQRHYCEHTEDIESLAVHSDGIVVASAQKENNAAEFQWSCRIWRTDSMTTMYILNNEGPHDMSRPIYLRFSPTKNSLLVLDDSKDHIISLWDIKGQKLASTSISRNKVQAMSWDRKNENVFATVGYEHIAWWEFVPHLGEIQMKTLADHRGFMKAKITLCLLSTTRNDLITGDSNGTIYVWGKGGNELTNYIKHAHESHVTALCMYKTFLLTGDKQGQIMLWRFDKNLDNLGMIMLPQGEGGVRHMLVASYSSELPVLIIGTTANSILQLPLAFGDNVVHPFEGVEFGVGGLSIAISQGHFGYLDCVSQVSTEESWFITAGRDGQICVFDGNKCLGVQKTMFKGYQFSCVQWTSEGSIILGTIDGRCIILEQQELNLVEGFNKDLCSCTISSIFLFPERQDIYIGGIDGSLTILVKNIINEDKGQEHGQEKWDSTTIQTSIYGIDFIQGGMDGEKYYLWLSNKSGSFVAYDISSLTVAGMEEIKNIHWSNQKCGLIPNIGGAWMTPLMKSEGVSAASVNEKKAIIALGTNKGKIAIYKYPCLKTNAYCHSNSTSKPVTSLLFLGSQEKLISVAGQHCCITQWRIL